MAVRPPFTSSRFSHPDIFEKIICPYNADAFDALLRKHNLSDAYPDLVDNLKYGFPLGDMPVLSRTNILHNHDSIDDHWPLIEQYLLDEIASGRMDGPFSQSEVESILRGPFQSSPLIAVIQPQAPGEPDKVRICRHLSKATKNIPSVNSFINKESFPTRFDTAIKVADIVAQAPPGTQACTFDIEKFHRTCPVSPHHKPWLVVQGRPGQFFIDHVHPFGASSASSNAGMIANAMVDIWRSEGVNPVIKYEDDLNAMRLPSPDGSFTDAGSSFRYDRASCLDTISSLAVPWHPEKGTLFFSSDFIFIGLRWNMDSKKVSLPEHKHLKFLDRVRKFISCFSNSACHLRDVERIHGSLCYISFVYSEGRSFLSSLSNFARSFGGNTFIPRHPPPAVFTDLKWWRSTLSSNSFTRSLIPLDIAPDPHIFVDASTSWGIGVVFGGRWLAFKLRSGWNIPRVANDVRRGICWLEMVAVELVIYAIHAAGFSHCRILIHSDNMGVIGAMAKGRSPNYHINLSIRRCLAVSTPNFILPFFEYVESALNPADQLSRGVLLSPSDRLPLNFSIPHELLPVLIPV